MNQNTPPGQSGHGYESGITDQGQDTNARADDVAANPYYANQHGASRPDLDANAPLLRSSDLQRLNRKAMFFLAGIVVLLVVAISWLWANTMSGEDEAAKPREEAVVIPEMPRTPIVEAPEIAPVPVLPDVPESLELPPLPAADAATPDYAGRMLPQLPSPPSLLERRMLDGSQGVAAAPPAQDAYLQAMLARLPGAKPSTQAEPATVASSAQFINNPDALLVRGTYIRCVLETRIVTDIPGFTSCIVTEPVYSINGRRLLLPKGSKVLGKYDFDADGPRVAVIWDRITTPNGIDVSMSSPGVDNLGGAGHPGDYDAHWGNRIASALLISLISDAFKYAAAQNGPPSTEIGDGFVVQSPYESTTARTMERLAGQALERSARRPGTVTINQGTVVNVYVAKDVDFSGVLARTQ